MKLCSIFRKNGCNAKNDNRITAFRDAVAFCGLSDLGYYGHPYTWTNNQEGADNILERLDRVLGNDAWTNAFPGFGVTHLARKSSDHCPLLLTLETSDEQTRHRPRPFRFEAMWLKHGGCQDLCEMLWASGGYSNSVAGFHDKIFDMGQELKIWEKGEFGLIRKKCNQLREELEELQKPN